MRGGLGVFSLAKTIVSVLDEKIECNLEKLKGNA